MNKAKKIIIFDYIKIVSSSLIVFHHYQQVFKCTFEGINFYGGRFNFGYLVELFFIMSGFLTVYSSNNTDNSRIKQLFHKLFSLIPDAFITILISLLLRTTRSIVQNNYDLIPKMWNLKTLLTNFFFVFAGYPHLQTEGINNPLWYICVLFQCYFIYYLIDWFIEKFGIKKKPIVFTSMLLILMIVNFYAKLDKQSTRGVSSFLIGIILCYVFQYVKKISCNNSRLKKQVKIIQILSFSISIISIQLMRYGINQRWCLQFLVYPMMIFALSTVELKHYNVVSELSNISFYLYIWHYPLMVVIQIITTCYEIEITHSYLTMTVFLVFAWLFSFMYMKIVGSNIHKKIKWFEAKIGK